MTIIDANLVDFYINRYLKDNASSHSNNVQGVGKIMINFFCYLLFAVDLD